jgi:hypothetical protein
MDETLARQFVAATNQMYDSLTLYETDRNLERQESNGLLMQSATIGCSLLGNAVYVQALVDDMMTLNERTAENRTNMQAITAVDHFDFFLAAEGRLLEAAGTDSLLITAILDQCREAQQAARRGEFNPFGFRALEDLRHAACGVLAELRDAAYRQPPPPPPGWHLEPPEGWDLVPPPPPGPPPPPPGWHLEPPERWHLEPPEGWDLAPPTPRYRRLKACLKGVCGCVVVGLDASALAGTLGLTAAGSAVSIAVGAAIVDHALGDLRAANEVWTPQLPPQPQRRNPPPAFA